jgi:hypothetical protein
MYSLTDLKSVFAIVELLCRFWNRMKSAGGGAVRKPESVGLDVFHGLALT